MVDQQPRPGARRATAPGRSAPPARGGGARRMASGSPTRVVHAETGVYAIVVLLVVVVGVVLLARSIVSDTQRQRNELAARSAVADNEIVTAATRVLDTWSRPGRGYREWWGALSPLLTPGGREAYAYTDPSLIPDLGDIAADGVSVTPGGTTATVYFTTADGRFGVDLSRRGLAKPWLANRVVFPDGESMFR